MGITKRKVGPEWQAVQELKEEMLQAKGKDMQLKDQKRVRWLQEQGKADMTRVWKEWRRDKHTSTSDATPEIFTRWEEDI